MESNRVTDKNKNEVFYSDKENLNQSNYRKKEKCNELKRGKDELISKQINEKTNVTKRLRTIRNMTKEDLQELCDHLSALNKRIQNTWELLQLRYDLPSEMRYKLELEAGELECLHKELQSAASNVETIQNQRAALQKEKLCMESQLSQLKADAINELEVIVSVYDAPMLERWAQVKAANSEAATENFLGDVKGKLQAMKNLQLLGSQKLMDLQKKENNWEENTDKKETKNRVQEESWDSNPDNTSRTSLAFLVDSDSVDVLDDHNDHNIQNVLYSLLYDQSFDLPVWTEDSLDVD